jgi:hypothetical protein
VAHDAGPRQCSVSQYSNYVANLSFWDRLNREAAHSIVMQRKKSHSASMRFSSCLAPWNRQTHSVRVHHQWQQLQLLVPIVYLLDDYGTTFLLLAFPSSPSPEPALASTNLVKKKPL